MNEDLSTLPWNEILSEDIFSLFTDSIQDYIASAPAEVVDGATTATEQPQVGALPPACSL